MLASLLFPLSAFSAICLLLLNVSSCMNLYDDWWPWVGKFSAQLTNSKDFFAFITERIQLWWVLLERSDSGLIATQGILYLSLYYTCYRTYLASPLLFLQVTTYVWRIGRFCMHTMLDVECEGQYCWYIFDLIEFVCSTFVFYVDSEREFYL